MTVDTDRNETPCWWLLGHRDKHACGCACVLPKGHKGRHACEYAVAALSDSTQDENTE